MVAIHELFCFLYIIIFCFSFIHSSCPVLKCASDGPLIRFPFNVQGEKLRNCSYPGFDLLCIMTDAVLRLTYSGDFYVQDINYLQQDILITDPGNCLPRRLLELNLSGSPFVPSYYQNYTFLRCPAHLLTSKYAIIDCLSNSTSSVLATHNISLAQEMSNSNPSCLIISTLPIPVPWPLMYDRDGFSSHLGENLSLNWVVPDCRACEVKGGSCGFSNSKTQELGCFDNSQPGVTTRSSGGSHVFRIIALSFTVPAVAVAIGISIFVCILDRRRTELRAAARRAIAPQPTMITSKGLDESTIQSYTKLVLGASGRVPGPNDTSCPICLSEYRGNDAVRCIPECKHCFHTDCVDEWLRMHNTCPVCRNTPPPAIQAN